jgi:hypothetical protein
MKKYFGRGNTSKADQVLGRTSNDKNDFRFFPQTSKAERVLGIGKYGNSSTSKADRVLGRRANDISKADLGRSGGTVTKRGKKKRTVKKRKV